MRVTVTILSLLLAVTCFAQAGEKMSDAEINPYASGAFKSHEGFMKYESYEQGRDRTSIVNCDECGGTGVVNAR